MTKWCVFTAALLTVLFTGDFAFADSSVTVIEGSGADIYFTASIVAAGFGVAVATWLTGLGQGNAIGKAVEGIARQPEAASKIQTAMIIGLAFIESLVIYALLISLIILFLNPFAQYFVKG